MSKKTPYYFISSLSFFLSTTIPVFAQEGYQLLAPIPTITNKTPSFVEFLKGIFVAGVGLAIIGAVMMIIIGALGYVMAAVPSAKAEGKKKMTDALFGLLIILVSTVILVTINPDLMRTGLNLAKLSPPQLNGSVYYRNGTYGGQFPTRAECEAGGSYTCTEQTPQQEVATGTPPPSAPDGGPTGNEQGNRDFLISRGIQVNAQPPQTVLAGVNQTTLNEITRLQMGCAGCDIVVTAGSEAGHADGTYSHTNGYKVDLRTTTSISNYIKDNYTQIATRSDGATQYQAPTGAIYALESDHWDVLVK